MIKRKLSVFSLMFLFTACGAKDTYKPNNFVSQEGVNEELTESVSSKNFYTLPLNGEVEDKSKFWSGDYWPMDKGNINYRWNSYDPIGFNLDSPTRDEAMEGSEVSFSLLSPSEKVEWSTQVLRPHL